MEVAPNPGPEHVEVLSSSAQGVTPLLETSRSISVREPATVDGGSRVGNADEASERRHLIQPSMGNQGGRTPPSSSSPCVGTLRDCSGLSLRSSASVGLREGRIGTATTQRQGESWQGRTENGRELLSAGKSTPGDSYGLLRLGDGPGGSPDRIRPAGGRGSPSSRLSGVRGTDGDLACISVDWAFGCSNEVVGGSVRSGAGQRDVGKDRDSTLGALSGFTDPERPRTPTEGVKAASEGKVVSGTLGVTPGPRVGEPGNPKRGSSIVGTRCGDGHPLLGPTAILEEVHRPPRMVALGPQEADRSRVGSHTGGMVGGTEGPDGVCTVQPHLTTPLVRVRVAGAEVVALCDTGACVSLISHGLWARVIGSRTGPLLPCRLQLVTAAGDELKPLGVAQVTLDIAGLLRRVEMRVVRGLQFDILLGYPALKIFGASVDTLADKLHLADGREVAIERARIGPLVHPVRLISIKATAPESGSPCLQVSCRAALPLPDRHRGLVFVPPESWSLTGPEVVELVDGFGVFTISVPNPGIEPGLLYNRGSCFGALELEAHRAGADLPAAVLTLASSAATKPWPLQWWSLCDESRWECSTQQRQQVQDLLSSFPRVGSRGEGDIGCTNLATCVIDTGDARPIKQRFRRTSPRASLEIKAEIEALLAAGVIRPSKSPWASPVVTVRKKDGSLRMCIDYRALNEVTLKDAYPLPDIDQVLERLGGSKFFCTLDLVSGYFQMKMDPDSIPKTAFTTEHGHFEYLRAPFGLATMPSQFQRMVQGHIDDPLQGIQCFLDDVIVHGSSFHETLDRLRLTLERLDSAGLKLKPAKCEFFRLRVNFLGHVVSQDGIAPDPEKVVAVEQWPVPTTVAKLRSFLGLVNYYRRMIPRFGERAAPLYALFKKGEDWSWSPECQESFEALRGSLTDAPVLAYPEFGPQAGQFILDTDASDVSIGAVLSQVQEGRERVICYGHKTLSQSQRNYCTTQRELLALVFFLDKYRRYLEGSDTLVRVDHAALKWLRRASGGNSMLQRWSSILEECGVEVPNGDLLGYLETFRYKVEYRPGVKHGNADALSRRPTPRRHHETCPTCAPEAAAAVEAAETGEQPDFPEVNVCSVTTTGEVLGEDSLGALWRWQAADQAIAAIVRQLRAGGGRPSRAEIAEWSARQLNLLAQWDVLSLNEDQFLCRLSKTGVSQLVIPETLIGDVLRLNHDSPGVNHEGISRTYARLKSRYYWPLMFSDIERYVRSCEVCLRGKTGANLPRPQLATWEVGELFSRLHVDFAGPLPPTARGNHYILVMVDAFSGIAVFVATRDCKADTTVVAIVHHWVCHYGLPCSIHSDRGTNFESDLLRRVCGTFGVQKTRTTAYHPQGNGRAEEMVRQCKQHLFLHLDQFPKDWDTALSFVTYSVRSGVSSSSGMSPFEVMTGQMMRTPSDAAIPVAPELGVADRSTLGQLTVHLRAVRTRARESLEAARDRQKFYHDRSSRSHRIVVGDMVWVRNSAHPKHQTKFTGPYQVLEVGQQVAVLFDPETGTESSVTLARLKREAPRADELLPRFELWQSPTELPGSRITEQVPRAEQLGEPGDDLLATTGESRWPRRERPSPSVYVTGRRHDPTAHWAPKLPPVAEAPVLEQGNVGGRTAHGGERPAAPATTNMDSPAMRTGKSAVPPREFLLPELREGERHTVELDYAALDRSLELPEGEVNALPTYDEDQEAGEPREPQTTPATMQPTAPGSDVRRSARVRHPPARLLYGALGTPQC